MKQAQRLYRRWPDAPQQLISTMRSPARPLRRRQRLLGLWHTERQTERQTEGSGQQGWQLMTRTSSPYLATIAVIAALWLSQLCALVADPRCFRLEELRQGIHRGPVDSHCSAAYQRICTIAAAPRLRRDSR